jgi:hypothetical protein
LNQAKSKMSGAYFACVVCYRSNLDTSLSRGNVRCDHWYIQSFESHGCFGSESTWRYSLGCRACGDTHMFSNCYSPTQDHMIKTCGCKIPGFDKELIYSLKPITEADLKSHCGKFETKVAFDEFKISIEDVKTLGAKVTSAPPHESMPKFHVKSKSESALDVKVKMSDCKECKGSRSVSKPTYTLCTQCSGTGGIKCRVCKGLGSWFKNHYNTRASATDLMFYQCTCNNGFVEVCYMCNGKATLRGPPTMLTCRTCG